MPIVPADPERHGRFIFGTWCASACEPRERLHELLRRGIAKAVVYDLQKNGKDGKPLFAGWAAVLDKDPQTVVWAYVPPRVRKGGNMVEMLTAIGTDVTQPMRAAFWSPACDGLIRNAWGQITYLSLLELAALYLRGTSADQQPHDERSSP